MVREVFMMSSFSPFRIPSVLLRSAAYFPLFSVAFSRGFRLTPALSSAQFSCANGKSRHLAGENWLFLGKWAAYDHIWEYPFGALDGMFLDYSEATKISWSPN